MNDRRELLGGNMVRMLQIGDMWISILHNVELGVILFYAILPWREQRVVASTHHVLRTIS